MKKNIIIVSAMEEESKPLIIKLSHLKDFRSYTDSQLDSLEIKHYIFENEDMNIMVLITGIGKVLAAKDLTLAISKFEFKVNSVVNIGSCCSLDDIPLGTIVQPYLIHDTDNSFNEPIKVNDIKNLYFTDDVKLVCMATGDSLMNSPQRRTEYGLRYHTYDMETYAYAQVCKCFGIDFNALRFISDDGTEEWETSFRKTMPEGSKKLAELIIDIYR